MQYRADKHKINATMRNIGQVAKLVDALGLGPSGEIQWEFESPPAHRSKAEVGRVSFAQRKEQTRKPEPGARRGRANFQQKIIRDRVSLCPQNKGAQLRIPSPPTAGIIEIALRLVAHSEDDSRLDLSDLRQWC